MLSSSELWRLLEPYLLNTDKQNKQEHNVESFHLTKKLL